MWSQKKNLFFLLSTPDTFTNKAYLFVKWYAINHKHMHKRTFAVLVYQIINIFYLPKLWKSPVFFSFFAHYTSKNKKQKH